MESLPKVDQGPTPLSYVEPETSQSEENVRMSYIQSPLTPLPPPPTSSFSPGVECSSEQHQLASAPAQTASRPKFICNEAELLFTPALTTCPSCEVQVITRVTYRAGTFAWLMCLVFVLCGLVLGCCLIPFCLNSFKDAYHTCPHCGRVLHVHKRTCCN